MKISRETSVFLVFTLIVAIVTGNPGAWFKLIFYTIGLVTLIVTVLAVLKALVTPGGRTHKNINTIADTITGTQTINANNMRDVLPIKSLKNIQTVHENAALVETDRSTAFVRNINATTNGRMPDSLVYPVAMKAMYEMRRKQGSLRYTNSVPTISQEEILRPLSKDEVKNFQEFCREQMIDLSLNCGKV